MSDPNAPRISDYNVLTDATGMTGFLPTQCFPAASFMLEKVDSPVIAVIGDPDQPITAKITSFLQTLISFQEQFIATLTPAQKVALGVDQYPDFEFMYFNSKSELDTYIQDPAYLTDDDHKGVCYGYQVTKSGNSYTADLFFNDQVTMGGSKSIGMPDQLNPVYNPTTNVPNLDDYLMLSQRGFVYLQNIAANIILQEETGNDNA